MIIISILIIHSNNSCDVNFLKKPKYNQKEKERKMNKNNRKRSYCLQK